MALRVTFPPTKPTTYRIHRPRDAEKERYNLHAVGHWSIFVRSLLIGGSTWWIMTQCIYVTRGCVTVTILSFRRRADKVVRRANHLPELG